MYTSIRITEEVNPPGDFPPTSTSMVTSQEISLFSVAQSLLRITQVLSQGNILQQIHIKIRQILKMHSFSHQRKKKITDNVCHF